jgi:hypothetical protein
MVAVATMAALGTAAGSSAGLLEGLVAPCDDPLSQPFLPWGDLAFYALAPNGGFESGSDGWRLGGDAAVVDGNEPFQVGGDTDASSLMLPPGSSAQSPPACIGVLYPTARLFVRNTGSPTSTLRVDVVYRDVLGFRWTVPVAHLAATSSWAPSTDVPLFANLTALPLVSGGAAQVAFRFTPEGDGGAWEIDDLYIDPYVGT